MRQRRPGTPTLSTRDREVLDLETKWGTGQQGQDRKLAEAKETLGLDPGGFALILNSLIDDPLAAAHAPETIARLKEIRDGRREVFGEIRRF